MYKKIILLGVVVFLIAAYFCGRSAYASNLSKPANEVSSHAVMSLGGIVKSKNLKIAGDRLNNDIISYMRDEFKILVGERTAEFVKISIGSVIPGEYMEVEIRGRDLLTGLPREVVVTDSDVREAISLSIKDSGIAEQLIATNGRAARGERR